MSLVKSFSVGNGDMYYIRHDSDNFSIIDCCMPQDKRSDILADLKNAKKGKGITRFISTHPDMDHIFGLKYLNKHMPIWNFYCVKNDTTKEDESDDFDEYCELKDSEKAFYIFKNCSRQWLNMDNDVRTGSGLKVLWPDTENEHYQKELGKTKNGNTPNNISTIIQYTQSGKAIFVWMGDLETNFMEKIINEVVFTKTAILFAPHHGRTSGKVPKAMLKAMNPDIIVIGEAPSEHLHYYPGYNTITQHSADDIIFDCADGFIDIYVSSETYSLDFLIDRDLGSTYGNYIGSLDVA